ncbi:major facilitator superfamily domain-containing protein [Paraphysoderma sedebokerense]|nr:major facilitator superfamily domain-containing protein [Paraphysoderma sedebokerense]
MKTHERTASNDPVDDQLNLEVLPENHEEKITPLPMRQMIVLSICIFGEPMSLSILFPFVYFMVESFHLTEDPKETGYYVGFVASCFSFAQFTTAVFWGWLSDKIGRRPVLLTGLIGNFLTLISFGMSKNLYWALGSRALCGFLNGNVGVAKCVLGEICDSTNQASGFAMFGLLWGIGTIAGPALGGFLADPARQFPSVFGSCEFLKQYPYFLPCFISSLISLAGFFIGYFYFEETHPKYASKKYQQPAEADIDIESESKNSHNVTSTEGIGKASYLTITGYALIALHGIIFDEVYTLYCVTPLSFGGLGFSSTDIGISLAAMGVIELGTQLLIYPKLTRRMSLLSIYKIAVIIFPVVYLFFPIISSIAQAMEFGKHPDSGEGIGSTIGINDGDEIKPTGSTLVFIWSSLFVPLTLRFFATVLGYTSIMMMVRTLADHRPE